MTYFNVKVQFTVEDSKGKMKKIIRTMSQRINTKQYGKINKNKFKKRLDNLFLFCYDVIKHVS